MKNTFKTALLAGIVLVSAPQMAYAKKAKKDEAAAPAASSAQIVPGLGVADVGLMVDNSDAVRIANQQRPTTYKAQIDAYNARVEALQNQVKPLVDKFQRDQQVPNPNQASLQQQATALQQIQENAQRELQPMLQPMAYSQAYVREQVDAKLGEAVKAAMSKRNITILLNAESVAALNNNAYNLNQDILAELNRLIPTAQLVPPTGWEPAELREAKAQAAAQQQGAQGAAAPRSAQPARPAGPQPEGR